MEGVSGPCALGDGWWMEAHLADPRSLFYSQLTTYLVPCSISKATRSVMVFASPRDQKGALRSPVMYYVACGERRIRGCECEENKRKDADKVVHAP